MKTDFYVFEEYDTETFKTSGSGLECVACGELFCKHIKYAMVHDLDADFVWGVKDWNEKLVTIPMFPSSNLWAMAHLSIVPEAPSCYAELSYVAEDGEMMHVSYLHPGEGRQVIRTTFVDFMLGRRKLDDRLICKSPSHKFQQEQKWSLRTNRTSSHRISEYWSVWAHKACIACFTQNSGSFPDDLVPSSESTSIW